MHVSIAAAEKIIADFYNISGVATPLHGEIDFNFRIKSTQQYILKISRPDEAEDYLDFQVAMHLFIGNRNPNFNFPRLIPNKEGKVVSEYKDADGNIRKVRLLSWIDGRLWSSVNPITPQLRYTLGQQCANFTSAMMGFEHPFANRIFDWDLNNAKWSFEKTNLFEGDKLALIKYFQDQFLSIEKNYRQLRKSLIHNDANDNNILVTTDLINAEVAALIDYGDAVHSQIINDLAVAIAYGVMNIADPLTAAMDIVKGFNEALPLQDNEIEMLYTLVAMRLVLSVTKSAQNKILEPENVYLQISDKHAWDLLLKWKAIHPYFACYAFRNACGKPACPQEGAFVQFAKTNAVDASKLFNRKTGIQFQHIDLGMSSSLLGNYADYKYSHQFEKRLNDLIDNNPNTIWAGGYGEVRPFYTDAAFKIPGNEGYELRTIHLGTDFWAKAGEAIKALFDGEVVACYDNAGDKDYGPVIILKHTINEQLSFFMLYGHLSRESLNKRIGQNIKAGEVIATIGTKEVNGNWPPHLHLQIIMNLLGNENNFDGVARPSLWPVFNSLCPDPNLFFNLDALQQKNENDFAQSMQVRKSNLGRSLSLSYKKHLTVLRGEGAYLYDEHGQSYLDTVNNVAHVGHENPGVVEAGQKQMAILNTNTRYLHPQILKYAKELLAAFPSELCVVHFVNSGSEANELAMRMAKTVTKQKDIIALEWGYHGNTQACVDVSSYKFNRKGGTGKPEYTSIVPLPDAFRGMYRGRDTAIKYANHIEEEIVLLKTKGRNVAAFLAESIVSCGGQVDLPEGYLKAAYDMVRSNGGLCIADEVQVGFGRVGEKFWAFEMHGVIPDIVTLGKPIGNGHPLGAVVCTKAVAEGFANGMEYFNTFGGNPVSCAIGRSVLKEIKEKKLQQNALAVGTYLIQSFNALKKDFPLIADVRGKGLFLGIELLEKDFTPATAKTAYVAERMRDKGILMSVDGPENNVLKIKPPICFSIDDANWLLENIKQVMGEDFVFEKI
jgi:4-aminobutyrate aminotransferase-like enzyme/Ser/Thr protein kinase RdoA (MazF antagonist)